MNIDLDEMYAGLFEEVSEDPPFSHLLAMPEFVTTMQTVGDTTYWIGPPLRFMGSVVKQIKMVHHSGTIWIDYGSDGNIRLPITTRMLKYEHSEQGE